MRGARYCGRLALLVGLPLMLLGFAVTWVPMPSHDGVSLRDWLSDFQGGLPVPAESEAALNEMGADCLPFLLREVERCSRTNAVDRVRSWLGRDPEKSLRLVAARSALLSLGTNAAPALPFLKARFIADPSSEWLAILQNSGEAGRRIVAAGLSSEDPAMWEVVSTTVSRAGWLSPYFREELARMVVDERVSIRRRVPEVIRRLRVWGGRDDALTLAALNDEDPGVRLTMLRVMAGLRPFPREIVERVRLLARDEAWPEVAAAAKVLAEELE